ncbi:MAG: hypothetical protein E7379_03680 [Clostridiales bacterium]|nr:hypothetical protein [Clostridiales bacterium]
MNMRIVNPHTILKLKTIFKLGYVASRGREAYKLVENNTTKNYAYLTNCLGHACFNLTNEQLKNFDESDASTFGNFIQSIFHANKYIAKDIFKFVKECGLKVSPSTKLSNVKDNEWKIALYFGWYGNRKDYHFLLQEKDETWSSKWGTTSELYFIDTPTKKLSHNGYNYNLYGFYKISNPHTKKIKNKQPVEKEMSR